MTAWAIDTAIAVSLLIVLVLLIRQPVARAFGARAAYALWLVPLLRVFVPPGGASAMLPVESAAPAFIPEIMLVTIAAPEPGLPIFANALPAFWIGGALAFLALHLFRHHRFIARALDRGIRLAPRGVPYDVIASDAVEGPLATGLLNPLILVPADFGERFTAEQQHLALLHEQLHHRRGDLWASAAALIVAAALWFNPFAHLALGAFRRDMEAACDTSVIALSNPAEAAVYAETILRSAVRPVPRSLCALTSLDELKGRLTMLTLNHSRGRKNAGIALAAAVTIGGVALPVPAVSKEPGETQMIEKRIIKHGPNAQGDVTRHSDIEKFDKGEFSCSGPNAVITAGGGTNDKNEQAKLLICADEGDGNKGLITALGRVRDRMDTENSDMDPAIRAQMKAKIDAKIAELRAKG